MNTERNEGVLELGGKKFPMRATMTALKEIDNVCGSIATFAMNLESMSFKVAEIEGVIHALVIGGMGPKEAPDLEELGELIADEGIVPSFTQVVPLLQRALTGGSKYQPKGGKKKSPKGKTAQTSRT